MARISNPELDALYEVRKLLTAIELELHEGNEANEAAIEKNARSIQAIIQYKFLVRK